jgi:hypothetical protein
MLKHGTTVGDEDERRLNGQLPMVLGEIGQELTLGLLVEGTRGLIEQEDAATAQEGTGNGNALRLSLGEACPTLAYAGVETLGEMVNKVGTGQV